MVVSLQAPSGGGAVQAPDLRPERGADGGAVRQRGPRPLHPLRGRAGASGLHGGDAPGQGSGPPLVREPQPADARLAAVPGEGTGDEGAASSVPLRVHRVC